MPRLIRRLYRLLRTITGVGVVLTTAVVLADGVGLLDRFERWLYDERVALFQFFTPPPTDRLVHLDIDDATIEAVGRWPWKRSTLAEIADEIALARPAVVGLDVLFSEPQEPDWKPDATNVFQRIDHDTQFAEALARIGMTLVPASLRLVTDVQGPAYQAALPLLSADPQLTEAEVITKLEAPITAGRFDAQDVRNAYLAARQAAVYRRIKRDLSAAPLDENEMRKRLLPNAPPGVISPLTRLVGAEYDRARAVLALEKHVPLRAADAAARPANRSMTAAPIEPLARTATHTGFVDFAQSKDGAVRAVPMFIESDGHLYPQFGLSLACALMGVPLDQIELRKDRVVVPRPNREPLKVFTHVLPARELDQVGGAVPMAIDLPWFGDRGSNGWLSMYSPPGGPIGGQHLSVVDVWNACLARQRIEQNNLQADAAIKALYAGLSKADRLAWHEANVLPAALWKERVARVTTALAEVKDDVDFLREVVSAAAPTATAPAGAPPVEEDAEIRAARVAVASFAALENFARQAPELAAQLDTQRELLRLKLRDKAIILGWTATGSIADFVATPLHDRCPGAVVHGVVFNAIMTGEVWRSAPRWATLLTTFAIGVLTSLIVAYCSPTKALVLSGLLALTYVLLNGAVLFDYGNILLGLAGPLTAIAATWSLLTLAELIIEQRKRALIRKRFRTYVDPSLVDYVEKHPGQASFAGERREMTVVFTDLVGFTTLTEVMGEKTVTLLNELWAKVVPVVRRDGGYLNKFLGDGVMFFYGAPMTNAHHARDACRTVLELHHVMERFRREVTDPRGLPALGMRIGLSTGNMIVGDAGAGELGSDYTVLGDLVNLGARFEGANKAFGTHNLMTARTAELAGGEILFRPIANVIVVGKEQSVAACEAICPLSDATPAQHQCAALTRAMVEAYQTQRFQDCLDAADALDAHDGKTKLASIYRDLAQARVAIGPKADFNSAISMTAK